MVICCPNKPYDGELTKNLLFNKNCVAKRPFLMYFCNVKQEILTRFFLIIKYNIKLKTMKELLKRIEIKSRLEKNTEIFGLINELLSKEDKDIRDALERKKKLYRNYLKRDKEKNKAIDG